MEQKFNTQLKKMWLLLAALAALMGWQSAFIIRALEANVYMNGAILAAFFYSCFLAFWQIRKLRGELIAFAALKEMWEDTRQGTRLSQTDPYWRHYRALKPGILFYPPEILGHAFELVYDEMARTKDLRVGVETMATLVHKIEEKLNESRSFINYMSGLLVFMGLIGAFIGLLKMVGSIGGILGGLQMAGGGTGSSSDAFARLLTDLQAPLSGMAIGFASSLFGLFTSLVVGLMGRFAHSAGNALKNEFESWLAGVAQINDNSLGGAVDAPGRRGSGTGAAAAATGGGGAESVAHQNLAVSIDPMLTRTLSVIMKQSQTAIDRTTEAMRTLGERQAEQTEAVRQSSDKLSVIVAQQTDLQTHISRMMTIGQTVGELKNEIGRMENSFEKRIGVSFEPLTRLIESALRAQFDTLERLSAQQTELTIAVTRLAEITPATASANNSELLQTGIVEGFERISQVLDASSRGMAHGLHQIAQQQANVNTLMARVAQEGTGERGGKSEVSALAESLETALTNGFIEISQAIETTFSAYSSMVMNANNPHPVAGKSGPRQPMTVQEMEELVASYAEDAAAAAPAAPAPDNHQAVVDHFYSMARANAGAAAAQR